MPPRTRRTAASEPTGNQPAAPEPTATQPTEPIPPAPPAPRSAPTTAPAAPASPAAAAADQGVAPPPPATGPVLPTSRPPQHVRYFDDATGQDIDPDTVFDLDNANTVVTAKVRVHQEVRRPGNKRTVGQLLFPRGAQVPRREAEAFVARGKATDQAAARQDPQ
jgi:hypothetical protein